MAVAGLRPAGVSRTRDHRCGSQSVESSRRKAGYNSCLALPAPVSNSLWSGYRPSCPRRRRWRAHAGVHGRVLPSRIATSHRGGQSVLSAPSGVSERSCRALPPSAYISRSRSERHACDKRNEHTCSQVSVDLRLDEALEVQLPNSTHTMYSRFLTQGGGASLVCWDVPRGARIFSSSNMRHLSAARQPTLRMKSRTRGRRHSEAGGRSRKGLRKGREMK